MRVLLPSSLPWDFDRFGDVDVEIYDPEQELPRHLRDAEAVVLWANPAWQRSHLAEAMPNLRWVQGLAAGADEVLSASFADDVILTSGRGLHDRPAAEHALALILACARRLHVLRDAQHGHEWRSDLGGVQEHAPGRTFRSLLDARITIWGFGSIAKTLSPTLQALGAHVEGIATREGTRAGVPVWAADDAEALLSRSDLLLMILPNTPHNQRLVGARHLASLPRHAWLVNVGRGPTLDEDALVTALGEGRLAGAALDVFEEEPLPPTSPLWDLKNVIVTPHASGGRPLGAQDLVLGNLARLRAGKPLENVIERNRGY